MTAGGRGDYVVVDEGGEGGTGTGHAGSAVWVAVVVQPPPSDRCDNMAEPGWICCADEPPPPTAVVVVGWVGSSSCSLGAVAAAAADAAAVV